MAGEEKMTASICDIKKANKWDTRGWQRLAQKRLLRRSMRGIQLRKRTSARVSWISSTTSSLGAGTSHDCDRDLGALDALDSIRLDEGADLGSSAPQPTSYEPQPPSIRPVRARYEGTWRELWLNLGGRREKVLISIQWHPKKVGTID